MSALTQWNTVILKKLTVAVLLKTLSAFYKSQIFGSLLSSPKSVSGPSADLYESNSHYNTLSKVHFNIISLSIS